MGEIQIVATFPEIAAANLDEFTKRAEDAVAAARDEAGTLRYDWFLSEDGTRCVVEEKYTNSAAVLVHLGNVGATVGSLAELGGGLVVEVFGELSPDVRKVLAPSVRTFYAHLTGR
ncbi:putative quinol monooxygenase [Nocardia sp. NPDC058379]|uniref:putative quinol monooxygenase n=1 Tax=unclassified Nocardia TaxID=2637762 RepID=UPI00365654BA